MANRPILLDTQIIIWLFKQSNKISDQVQAIVDNSAQPVAVSYVSLMEMAIKHGAGKLDYSDTVFEDLAMLDIALLMPGRSEFRQYRVFVQK